MLSAWLGCCPSVTDCNLATPSNTSSFPSSHWEHGSHGSARAHSRVWNLSYHLVRAQELLSTGWAPRTWKTKSTGVPAPETFLCCLLLLSVSVLSRGRERGEEGFEPKTSCLWGLITELQPHSWKPFEIQHGKNGRFQTWFLMRDPTKHGGKWKHQIKWSSIYVYKDYTHNVL